ncbi:FxsB family cyclophane-forming radical SAM/SPASM peptide maturase [Actinokineospora iranica]|uniref:Radical SAM core domain-containing protein n=1 Tax=Actinokineospora iranica TaxID=1271860 RepID=A0A1G6WPJ5_9PSEU|nr:FxsB family cyclophane-forming radical SAM/SPASM peptide maturase [Actinokineospora iranica]SDD66955.1 uncharacterized protein SAMN05216174_11581 [Actinokineospora iranica]
MTDQGLRPFRQFVLKAHSRCNLACDYCYVYKMADQGWRAQPHAMSRATVENTADRIAEHARAHGLGKVDIALHGGEPLLAGRTHLAWTVRTLRERVPAEVRVTVQTNGTLLDEDFLHLFADLGVRVGVSVDGDARTHDHRRRGHDGAGSHGATARGLRLLAAPEFRPIYAGLLCVVDLSHDPLATYSALLEHEPPAIDLLLPHGNWTAPPPRREPGSAETPYADWLGAVFDHWYAAPVKRTSVRLFDELLNLLLNGRSGVESIGAAPAQHVVVQTDGSIELSDTLASAYDGAAITGLHVSRDPFDAALRPEPERSRACATCPELAICGGGLPAHRYRADNGFTNPSVYCPDLLGLIHHVRTRLTTDLAALR